MFQKTNYSGLPNHMIMPFKRYIEHGIPPGGFGTAVICNKLFEAFARADGINTARMKDIVSFFYNEAPSLCWGSEEKMNDWRKAGGTVGISNMEDKP